ncbi:hypothetical protein PTKIN_Ptkin16aG0011200 [Pterospermum kingtungense]
MDIFIGFRSKKPFTFAFVRYRSESECGRAVVVGNQRIIDGRIISVRRAQYGRSNRKNLSRDARVATPHVKPAQAMSDLRARDSRSCKEVLMENFNNKASEGNLDMMKDVGESFGRNDLMKDVSFCYELKQEDVEWLDFIIIGRLKDNVDWRFVAKIMSENDVPCQVSPLGGVSIAIIFQSHERMIKFLDKEHMVAEVPLQLWNVEFFKALGNRWGTFVRADYFTLSKERLDFARILVTVESRLDIPGTVSVSVKDVSYKIVVSLEEDNPVVVNSGSYDGVKSKDEDDLCSLSVEVDMEKMKSLQDDSLRFVEPSSLITDSYHQVHRGSMLTKVELNGGVRVMDSQVSSLMSDKMDTSTE